MSLSNLHLYQLVIKRSIGSYILKIFYVSCFLAHTDHMLALSSGFTHVAFLVILRSSYGNNRYCTMNSKTEAVLDKSSTTFQFSSCIMNVKSVRSMFVCYTNDKLVLVELKDNVTLMRGSVVLTVVLWLACLTLNGWMPVRCVFEHLWLLELPSARIFTLIT